MSVRPKHNWPRRWNPTTERHEVEVEPGVWVSRQRAWQMLRQARGLCGKCGRKRRLYSNLCDACEATANILRQKAKGHKAWTPGGLGRPPRTAKRRGTV